MATAMVMATATATTSEDDANNRQGQQRQRARTTTARTTATTARTTTTTVATAAAVAAAFLPAAAKVDSGGSAISAGGGQGNIRLVAVLHSALVVLCLHTVGMIKICFGINVFRSKVYLACPDMPNRVYSIRIYSRLILCLFWSKSGSKPFIPILAVTHYKINY